MSHIRIEEASDHIISNITPPAGWTVAEEVNTATEEIVEDEEARLKRIVNQNLEFVTGRVEAFVDMAYKDFNILIFESYIFIDADAAFHIMLLVNHEDLVSPHMIALKIQAKEQLTTDEDVSMRFQFTNAEEYARFHDTQRTYKLRYMYKHPAHTGEAINFVNIRNVPHWVPNHQHHSEHAENWKNNQ